MARKTSRGHKSITINIKVKWDEKKWAINVEFVYRRETRKVLYKDMKEMVRAKSRFAFSAHAKDGGKIKRGE